MTDTKPLSHRMTSTERCTVAWFLRRESLWRLVKAAWKFRRMPSRDFDLVMYIESPLGEPAWAHDFPVSRTSGVSDVQG